MLMQLPERTVKNPLVFSSFTALSLRKSQVIYPVSYTNLCLWLRTSPYDTKLVSEFLRIFPRCGFGFCKSIMPIDSVKPSPEFRLTKNIIYFTFDIFCSFIFQCDTTVFSAKTQDHIFDIRESLNIAFRQ